MLSEKAILGLLKAPPEKRYKSFLNMVTDLEEVWIMFLLDENGDWKAESIYAVLWPCKEFLRYYNIECKQAISMEIHEFLESYNDLDETIQFIVFPTEKDFYMVTWGQLYNDIVEHLEEIE